MDLFFSCPTSASSSSSSIHSSIHSFIAVSADASAPAQESLPSLLLRSLPNYLPLCPQLAFRFAQFGRAYSPACALDKGQTGSFSVSIHCLLSVAGRSSRTHSAAAICDRHSDAVQTRRTRCAGLVEPCRAWIAASRDQRLVARTDSSSARVREAYRGRPSGRRVVGDRCRSSTALVVVPCSSRPGLSEAWPRASPHASAESLN